MSLATRCTSCGTVFRVVQDQLKVSEGWVRCGQCSAVFNALEGLFDLHRDVAAEAGAGAGAGAERSTAVPEGRAEATIDVDGPATEPMPLRPEHGGVEAPGEAAALTAPAAPAVAGIASADLSSTEHADAPAAVDPPAADHRVAAPGDEETRAFSAADPVEAPAFVREAQRRARWRAPAARAAGGFAVLLLTVALVVQAGLHFRDTIAARWPATQGALKAACAAANCSVQAPRRIEDLVVESTALTRSLLGPGAFRLDLVLRNRGALPVAPPSLDLGLTDAQGQIVSRRMLSPPDFGVSTAALRPGSESNWQLLLSTDSERVVGYKVEVFYP